MFQIIYPERRLLKRVEDSLFLPHEHHGVRLGHTPIELPVFRRLSFDYVIQSRSNYVLVYYDEDNCYYCMAHIFFTQ